MKKSLFGGLIFVLAAGLFLTADTPAAEGRDGQKALLFSISGLGNFGVAGMPLGIAIPKSSSANPAMAGLGMKYYLSNRLAFRGSLAFGWTSATDIEYTSLTLGFAPAVEYHFLQSKSVEAYIGGGGAVGIFRDDLKNIDPEGEAGEYGTPRKYTGNVYALMFLCGVEVFPLRNLSFGAEYQIGANATRGKAEYGNASVEYPTKIYAGIGTVAVTLAVYW